MLGSDQTSLGETFSYEVVPGYFIQTDDSSDPATVGPNPPAFGLKANTSTTYWSDFTNSIAKLQKEAPRGVKYAVCWFGPVMDRGGTMYPSRFTGRKPGTTIGPCWMEMRTSHGVVADPELTDLGKQQAQLAHDAWVTELAKKDPVPLPTKLFLSPLSRAASTLEITFRGILLGDKGSHGTMKPLIMENLREDIGEHTCDKRRTRTYLQGAYPDFCIEAGFTEEDELWTADHRETDDEISARLKAALDTIFGRLLSEDDTFFSITAHGGAITAALRVLGHRPYALATGGVILVVIKATRN
ncbi:hypothetical protein FRC08_006581 [Ceratobasidium sp. 394]|nr:hypothetical protein FRC08_006581 [Ceratobasidium sp. 394]